jgi:hypothetical protein
MRGESPVPEELSVGVESFSSAGGTPPTEVKPRALRLMPLMRSVVRTVMSPRGM